MRSLTRLGLAAGLVACSSLGLGADNYWISNLSTGWYNSTLWSLGQVPTGEQTAYVGYNSPGFTFTNPLAVTLTSYSTNLVSVRDIYTNSNLTIRNLNVTGNLVTGPSARLDGYNQLGLHTINHLTLGTSSVYRSLSPIDTGTVVLGANASIVKGNSYPNSTFHVRSLDLGTNGLITVPYLVLKANASITGDGTITAGKLDFRTSGLGTVDSRFVLNNVKVYADTQQTFTQRFTGNSTILGGATKLVGGFSGTLTVDTGLHEHFGTSSGVLAVKNGAQFENRGDLNLTGSTTSALHNFGTLTLSANSELVGYTKNFGELRTTGATQSSLTIRSMQAGYLNVKDTSRLHVRVKDTKPTLATFRSVHVDSGAMLTLFANTGRTWATFSNHDSEFDFGTLGSGKVFLSSGVSGGTVRGMSNVWLGNVLFDGVRMPGTQSLNRDPSYTYYETILNDHKSESGDNLTVTSTGPTTLKNSAASGKLSLTSGRNTLENVRIKTSGDITTRGPAWLQNVENYGILNLISSTSANPTLLNVRNFGNMSVTAAYGVNYQFQLQNYGNLTMRPTTGTYLTVSPLGSTFQNFGHARFFNMEVSNLVNRGRVTLDGSAITFADPAAVGLISAENNSKVYLPVKGLEVERNITTIDQSSAVFVGASLQNQTISTSELATRQRFFYNSDFKEVNFSDPVVTNIVSGSIENSSFAGLFSQSRGIWQTLSFRNTPVPSGSTFTDTMIDFYDQQSIPRFFKAAGVTRISKAYRSTAGVLRLDNFNHSKDTHINAEVTVHGQVVAQASSAVVPLLTFSSVVNYGNVLEGRLNFLRGENRGLIKTRDSVRLGDYSSGYYFRNYGSIVAKIGASENLTNYGSIMGHPDYVNSSYFQFSGTNHGVFATNFGEFRGNNFGTMIVRSADLLDINVSSNLINESGGTMILEGRIGGYGYVVNRGNLQVLAKEHDKDLRLTNSSLVSIATQGVVPVELENTGTLSFRRNSDGVLPVFRPGYSDTSWSGSIAIEGTFAPGFAHEFFRGTATSNLNHSLTVLTPGWSVVRGGNSLNLHYLVPEPNSLFAVALGALLLRRRRA